MKVVRCFIAIDFPREIMDEIARVQEELGKLNQGSAAPIMKLTEKENLHLTMKFLGEIEEEKIDEIRKKLREIKFQKFKCFLGELGVFSKSFIRIVWIHILGKEIEEMQKAVDEKLSSLFEKEERFMSHLTIARIKFVKDRKLFLEEIKKITVKKLEFPVSEFYLVKSELKPEGPVYTEIEKFSLI